MSMIGIKSIVKTIISVAEKDIQLGKILYLVSIKELMAWENLVEDVLMMLKPKVL